MKTKLVAVLAALGVVLVATAVSLRAHHAFSAEFDANKPLTFKGTISKMEWTNPHVWLHLDVKKPDGSIETWSFEAGTPSGMIRNGYKASVIKQGDEVTITGFHAKDPAQNMGMLRELTTSDGTVFGLFGPQQGPSAQ